MACFIVDNVFPHVRHTCMNPFPSTSVAGMWHLHIGILLPLVVNVCRCHVNSFPYFDKLVLVSI